MHTPDTTLHMYGFRLSRSSDGTADVGGRVERSPSDEVLLPWGVLLGREVECVLPPTEIWLPADTLPGTITSTGTGL